MKPTIALAIFLGYTSVCFAADESQEPPVKYTLELSGQKQELILDTPVTVSGTFNNPKLLLKAAVTRQFACGDVTFQYPASYTWEASINGPNKKTWTLSGNDFKIMVFVVEAPIEPGEYLRGLAQQVHSPGAPITDIERELGGRKFQGKRSVLKIGSVDFVFEVYILPYESGSRMLVLQDSPAQGRASSSDGERSIALLLDSFRDTAIGDRVQ